MGTRADFYIGRGKDARWLGSVAWDGYADAILDGHGLGSAKTEDEFTALVEKRLAHRDDGTRPEMGWPWPWENSHTTDYSYAFDDGQVFTACFGYEWLTVAEALDPDRERAVESKTCVFPDMSALKNVTYGPRSGVIMLGIPK
jgi:hypothetical protein